MENQQSQNPLLVHSKLPYEAVEFPKYKVEHYLPALKTGIEMAKKSIAAIKDNPEPPSFENTIFALEISGEEIDLVSSVFYNLLSSETNDEMQALAPEFGPILSAYSSDLLLDEKLFERIKTVHDNRDNLELNTEEKKLLEDAYQDFARNGALLDEEGKKSLREIDQEMAKISPQFSENLLKAMNAFELVIDNEADLAGLPDSSREAAKMAAEEKKLDGKWLFTLHYPSSGPFQKYADNRELREKMYMASATRATSGDTNNQELVLKIAQLRQKRANLLGYESHAHFVLEKRMAESPEKVEAFLKRLYEASKPAASKDVAEVQAFADELNGPNPLMPWDFGYYAEKLREKKYSYNDEELRPYFKLENVIAGVFEHARRLYGLNFEETTKFPTYHPDVKVYEVFRAKDNKFMGLFYADFFPRPGKRSGAWMTNFHEQGLRKGNVGRPHVSIVCNFTKPTNDKPSLLTFDEVRTLFHEFGHSLHSLLSDCHYRSLSGTNVYWDFVELPSQVLENWIFEKQSLELFAKHYETDEVIPDHYITKIKDSSKFLAGYASLRQLSLGYLDMAWHHNTTTDSVRDVFEFERKAVEHTQILPKVDGTNTSCAFGHIFAGGYSAGYYSYKWAEVLDADAFEVFKEKGIFHQEAADAFMNNILARGGTEHPMELYKSFRGREPDPDALLRRDGLI